MSMLRRSVFWSARRYRGCVEANIIKIIRRKPQLDNEAQGKDDDEENHC